MKTTLRNSGVRLLLAIIFLSGALHAQEKKSEKALLWKISGNGLQESSYLFGTYHLLGSKFLTEVPETEQPFAKAKGIVVETIIDSSKIQALAMKSIMTDTKISALISPDDFKLVADELQSVSGYSLTMLDMVKPAQINVLIGIMSIQKLNAEILTKYSGTPLDIYFAAQAKKENKIITPLETMESQFDMLLDHFPVEEQARQLVENVKQKELAAKAATDMIKLYLEKDLEGMHFMMDSYPEDLTGNMDYMLKERNEAWIKVLPGLMKSGSQFIAVGAGHLLGADGLIALLRKEGYTVKPVTK
jgi:uncharacterized protein YbaP (TraB family)